MPCLHFVALEIYVHEALFACSAFSIPQGKSLGLRHYKIRYDTHETLKERDDMIRNSHREVTFPSIPVQL